MNRRRVAAGLLPAVAFLLLAADNQDPPPAGRPAVTPTAAAPRPVATLHQAWLVEVMDLEPQRATDLYREVARDKSPDNLERWVALARLVELHRIGVAPRVAVDPIEVPVPLRAAMAAATAPLDVAALLALAGDPDLLQARSAESGRLPLLRPAVAEAEAWLIDQVGPNWRDRRQRQQSPTDRPPFSDRFNAVRIVVAELDGNRRQADEARSLYFTQWRPPATSGDHAASLARVRANFDYLLRDHDLARSQQDLLLQRLRDAIDKMAATDPASAMALVLRLPVFAELLLRDVPAARR